ncbi:perilipin-2-like isoform X2 [Cynoglossus semilaevis]|uniref:Perilipin-2-like n=1 Tax=Cynoglossus semilaevis TaxID=244447 RepID=A0A3P8V0L3_CYNSE|nr:perilipin-2-like isoform X2 [Cynoglossus semilaevis]
MQPLPHDMSECLAVNGHRSNVSNMPRNNNQKAPNAAARFSRFPVVRSAYSSLSLVYSDTKRYHPRLKSVCEVLENSVSALGTAASDRVSPVIVQLQPQISAANDVACKSLDWLEITFPVLHTPAEEIVATARTMINEIQDVVRIAAHGTLDCVTWVLERMQQVEEGTKDNPAGRAISVAGVGLDSALSTAESLMDRVLPPTKEDRKAAVAHLVQGFEVSSLSGGFAVRLVSLTAELCRRTFHMVGAKVHCVQVETLSKSSALVQDLQFSCLGLVWNLQGVPQYLQHQAISALFFISQMYGLTCSQSQQTQCSRARSPLKSTKDSLPQKDTPQVHPTPTSHTCLKAHPPKVSPKVMARVRCLR